MEDLFDEKLLEAIRLAEALQDGQSEEKEPEGKKTEVKQETENSRPVSRTEEPVAAPVPQTGEEAVDQLIKEIVQETQEEIAAEGIQTEDIRKEFFQKKAEKAKREKKKLDPELESRPVYAPKKLKDPWSLRKKVCVILLVVVLVVTGIPAGIFARMYMNGKNRLAENAQGEKVSFHTDGSSSTAITYKGKNYVYNTDTVSILVFGVDNSEYVPKESEKNEEPKTTEAATEETKPKKSKKSKKTSEDTEATTEADLRDRDDALTYSDANGSEYVRYGGRIDLCFLVVFDLRNDKLHVININRDSMTDVDIKTIEGKTALTDRMQIGLAYGYGDGEIVSCENFTHAVSGLMYNLPINGYVAFDMDAMADINDVLSGVTLTARDTISENVFEKDVVTLQGNDAYRYLEKMDTVTDAVGEHGRRMERQSQYLAGWLERFEQCYSDDKGIIKKVYEAASPYLQTNLDRDACLYLFSRMRGMDIAVAEKDIQELPGTYERPAHFDEYQVDTGSLVEEMLDIFYIPTS